MNDQQLLHGLIDIFKFKENHQIQTSGLLPQDMYVLERIYFSREANQKAISEEYHIPPSTLTGIIDRLEKKELIKRIRGNKNRKIVTFELTEGGMEQIRLHIKEDKIFALNFFNTLSDDKKRVFRILVGEIIETIDKEALFKEGEPEND